MGQDLLEGADDKGFDFLAWVEVNSGLLLDFEVFERFLYVLWGGEFDQVVGYGCVLIFQVLD